MRVLKRDGRSETVSFDKVIRRIKALCVEKPVCRQVDYIAVAQKVCSRIYDGVKTSELDELTANTCISMSTDEPEYGIIASRIIISNNHKNTPATFAEAMRGLYANYDGGGKHIPIISESLYEAVGEGGVGAEIERVIDYRRDYLFDYFGFKTLEKSYLKRVIGADKTERIMERPQHMWMRVALGIHGWDTRARLERAFETYHAMSQKQLIHATPTLFHSGTPSHQFLSCFLLGLDDSISGIYKCLSDCAQISKWAGGIGFNVSNIRSRGALIRGTNGKSDGVVPMLKVFNDTAVYVNQSGKRNGSFAVYLEPWHPDIFDFLELKKNHGDEAYRCRDLFYAVWLPDLFMERVERGETWSLFDPDECPNLSRTYGDEFRALYEGYEREGKYRRQVKAQDIFNKIIESQIETGTPYIGYKDAVNRKSNQKNLGTIMNSNLCVAPETMLLTRTGYARIDSLVDKEVEVWNGENWSTSLVRKTGANQPLMKITFDNGSTLECTPYHKFYVADGEEVVEKRACALKEGDNLESYKMPMENDPMIRSVLKIENKGRVDDTYCFNEPIRHKGVMNGILTGNCHEITEYSDSQEYACCTLGSLGLPAFLSADGKYDFQKLGNAVRILVRNLNIIIDTNFYPVPETQRSNLRHRPIGIGVQGLADVYMRMRMPFDSKKASELNRKIFATIYYHAMDESVELAKSYAEKLRGLTSVDELRKECVLDVVYDAVLKAGRYMGAYSTFEGSPLSEGLFQFDLWGVEPEPMYDWAGLRAKVLADGVRNSMLIAPMPTASTSQILGNTECFEPLTSNIYVRRVLAGDYIVVNRYLIEDLKRAGLWSKQMKDTIILNNGSIQSISQIPADIRELYKTSWDLSMRTVIDQCADRGAYICQTQSMNLFMANADFNKIRGMHLYAWKRGLKTGIYYLRTLAVAKAQQVTVDQSLLSSNQPAYTKPTRPADGAECTMCSS